MARSRGRTARNWKPLPLLRASTRSIHERSEAITPDHRHRVEARARSVMRTLPRPKSENAAEGSRSRIEPDVLAIAARFRREPCGGVGVG
jgi:hypothetical protein